MTLSHEIEHFISRMWGFQHKIHPLHLVSSRHTYYVHMYNNIRCVLICTDHVFCKLKNTTKRCIVSQMYVRTVLRETKPFHFKKDHFQYILKARDNFDGISIAFLTNSAWKVISLSCDFMKG